jgi:hypothetical protein
MINPAILVIKIRSEITRNIPYPVLDANKKKANIRKMDDINPIRSGSKNLIMIPKYGLS